MGSVEKATKYINYLKKYDNVDWGVNILTVDFEQMQRGKVKKDLKDQIETAIYIKSKYPAEQVKVFMGVDPNRKGLYELIAQYLPYIDGFKIYCYNGGFFPYDENLDLFYQIAESNNKPVIYHCSYTNINYYGGKDIKERLKKSLFPLLKPKKDNNKFLSTNFCNPLGFEVIAKRYPKLMIQIAHWGGNDSFNTDRNFTNTVTRLICLYENVFADISFFCHDLEACKFIVDTARFLGRMNKVIFATDYFMSESVTNLDTMFQIKELLTPEEWEQITTNFDRHHEKNSSI
jgi:predicted TIM-barrel fold metal-dependent hydrolase